MTLGAAKTKIASDGFTFGGVIPQAATDDWFVSGQTPDAGTQRQVGSAVTVTAVEAKPDTCP
jgi:hypothetical protein